MTINKKPVYQRIMLKLSGETLQGSENFGINPSVLEYVVQEIKVLIELGIQVSVVIGGGNLFRGASLAKSGMNRVVGDQMGMLATVINGLAIRDALHHAYLNARLMSAIPLNGICDTYSWSEAINSLSHGCIVIFSAGTGNPCFTTDSTACLRAIEIEADIVLKATKVDGVYSEDPVKDHDAVLYKRMNYRAVLEGELKIMDLTAFTLARDYNLPICVFNINKPGALRRVVIGENEGTLISDN
ncbi:Uridylate kinase [Candidatus Hartigia pinicola]|nr:Uridylate kinase [Candidatus Hartigia pinicola]